jgi:hypothetical protein
MMPLPTGDLQERIEFFLARLRYQVLKPDLFPVQEICLLPPSQVFPIAQIGMPTVR